MAGRYKSHGWFGESHRHYLAAKGFSTGRKYFARKGNFAYTEGERDLHSLWAQGLSNQEISRVRPDLAPYMGGRGYEKRVDVSSLAVPQRRVQEVPFVPSSIEVESPMPVASVQQEVSNPVMAPGPEVVPSMSEVVSGSFATPPPPTDNPDVL